MEPDHTPKKAKRVLVTGATGFVGRHSLGPLLGKGYEVHAVTSRQIPVDALGVWWHQADLLDTAVAERLVADVAPTHLLHFAWYAAPGKYVHALENISWLQASLSIIKAFGACGGRRIVTAGTLSEYDPNFGRCREFETPLLNTTLYGAAKGCLGRMLGAFGLETGLSTAHGRVWFLYGPHEYPQRLVASVCLSLLRGEVARCTHGNQIRDFLHVRDMAEGFVALLESDVTGPVNVASGRLVTLKEIVTTLAGMAGREDLLELGVVPARPSEPEFFAPDVRRLSIEVGWRPRYDLRTGLAQTLEWWKQHLPVK